MHGLFQKANQEERRSEIAWGRLICVPQHDLRALWRGLQGFPPHKGAPISEKAFNCAGNRSVFAELRVALGNLSGAGFVGIVEALLTSAKGH